MHFAKNLNTATKNNFLDQMQEQMPPGLPSRNEPESETSPQKNDEDHDVQIMDSQPQSPMQLEFETHNEMPLDTDADG